MFLNLLFRLFIASVQNHKWFLNPLQSGSFYIPPLKHHYQCPLFIKVSWPKTSLPMASLSFKLMNNLPGLFCLNFYYILMWINSCCLLKLVFLAYMTTSFQSSWLIPLYQVLKCQKYSAHFPRHSSAFTEASLFMSFTPINR